MNDLESTLTNLEDALVSSEGVSDIEVRRMIADNTTDELIETIITLAGIVRLYNHQLAQAKMVWKVIE